MKTKFTPVPWQIQDEGSQIVILSTTADEQQQPVICRIYNASSKRSKANAQLIVNAVNERDALLKVAAALRLMQAHYTDLSKSNPGFMGKLCLQHYGLWNEALLEMDRSLANLAAIRKATE